MCVCVGGGLARLLPWAPRRPTASSVSLGLVGPCEGGIFCSPEDAVLVYPADRNGAERFGGLLLAQRGPALPGEARAVASAPAHSGAPVEGRSSPVISGDACRRGWVFHSVFDF